VIRTVIIDDEKSCRESLRYLLQEYCDDVEVVGLADSVDNGCNLILSKKPDLVFLDILMPREDGFKLFQKLPEIDFEVIFTTAYDTYALEALRHEALDYLLKPIDIEELKESVAKVSPKASSGIPQLATQKLTGKIVLNSRDSIVFLEASEIIRLESEGGSRTIFYLKNNREMLLPKSIGDFESQLEGFGFFRCHRAHIINLKEMTEYFPDKSGGLVLMSDGKAIPVAARRKEEFIEMLNL
jgi:two-component system, LytTR family, response regulator